MKKVLATIVLALTLIHISLSQTESDSLKILRLDKEIQILKSANENLSGSLEITNMALSDLIKDKNISDETRWLTLKSGLIHSTQIYKKLSDDIINLKSRMTDQDYQGFINSLGSLEGGPLGFSFEEVIMESVKRIGIFENKSRVERFMEITNSIIASPIVASVPFMSQAVLASNSLMNVAYSSLMTEKKPDFVKLNRFETELNKYLTYFSALDKANALNQSSNNDRILLLENLQLELLSKLKKESPKLGHQIPERKEIETIDAYFNRVLNGFSPDYVQGYLNGIESKYKNNRGVINYASLLQQETDLRYYSNHMNSLMDQSKRFIMYYDNFFEIADNYQIRILEAIDLANTNGIIKGRKANGTEESPKQVYERINKNLRDKKSARDNGIKDSINISDLKQKIEKIEEFKM
jgi:primosomal protein N''